MTSKTIQLVMVVAGEVPDGGVELRAAPQSDGTPGRILPTKYVVLPIDVKDFMEASPEGAKRYAIAMAINTLTEERASRSYARKCRRFERTRK